MSAALSAIHHCLNYTPTLPASVARLAAASLLSRLKLVTAEQWEDTIDLSTARNGHSRAAELLGDAMAMLNFRDRINPDSNTWAVIDAAERVIHARIEAIAPKLFEELATIDARPQGVKVAMEVPPAAGQQVEAGDGIAIGGPAATTEPTHAGDAGTATLHTADETKP